MDKSYMYLYLSLKKTHSHFSRLICKIAYVNGLALTANIFESGPMPTPWKFLDSLPAIPSC